MREGDLVFHRNSEIQHTVWNQYFAGIYMIETRFDPAKGLKLSWTVPSPGYKPTFLISCVKTEGELDPATFRGMTPLYEGEGEGNVTDSDIKEGRSYLYSFHFMRTDVEVPAEISDIHTEFVFPITIPLSRERLRQLEELEQLERMSPLEKVMNDVQGFIEMERSLDDAERSAIKQVRENIHYTDEEKKFRESRIRGYFREARQKRQ